MMASLSHNARAFLENAEVLALIGDKGTDILPITVLNGRIISTHGYMTYEQVRKEIASELDHKDKD